MKKGFLFIIFACVLTIMMSDTVSAKQIQRYTVNLPARNTVNNAYITAASNYVYAVNDVTQTTGSPNVHSYYQTSYNGSAVTIGGEISVPGAGYTYDSAWKPTGVSSNPSGYNIYSSKNCTGNNTTSNYCAIQGSQYRLRIDNKNYIYSITVTGIFTLD